MKRPNPDLYDRIINRINYENKLLILKRRLFLYAFSLLASSAALAPLLVKLYEDSSSSGFLQFLSLLFTDFEMVVSNLNDYLLSILESLPVISFTMIFISVVVFVFSYSKFSDSLVEIKKSHY